MRPQWLLLGLAAGGLGTFFRTEAAPPNPPRASSFQLNVRTGTASRPLPRPASFYHDQAATLLQLMAGGDSGKLKLLVTDRFFRELGGRSQEEFRRQWADFAAQETLVQRTQPGVDATIETMFVLKNSRGRKITAHFLFVADRIDLCVVKTGVQ